MTNLETLQTIFNNRAFVIPDYQRGYAWENKERDDLLNDLDDLAQMDISKLHYTGTLVLHGGTHPAKQIATSLYQISDIVDGQQRLTTLIILLNRIAHALDNISDEASEPAAVKEAATDLRSNYVKKASLQGALQRLTLNGEANAFFKDHIISDMPHPNPKTAAQTNLWNARLQFDQYLDKKLNVLTDGNIKVSFLMDLVSRITNRFGFVLYEVDSQAEVGVMFEVMNARGKPLTQLEKVKNYLLYLASRVATGTALQNLSDEVNQTWSELLHTLTEAGSQASEDQFMRYHWAIYPGAEWFEEGGRARTFDIHRALKETLTMRDAKKSPSDLAVGISDYLQSLRSLVVSYRDVLNPSHHQSFADVVGTTSDKELLRETARTLRRSGRTATILPVLIAAHYKLHQNVTEMQEIFRLCETFAFRLGAVEKNASTGETYAYSLAADMMAGQASFASAKKRLSDLILYYCSDHQLKNSLLDSERNFYNWRGLKFFLYEYEKHLTLAQKLHFVVDWAAFFKTPKEDTIEHILPQGNNTGNVPYWGGHFTSDEMAAYRNRLGNLCLTSWNSSYSNKPFPEKRGNSTSPTDAKVYKNSPWQNERELCKEPDWTKTAIETRQEKLVQFALARWKV